MSGLHRRGARARRRRRWTAQRLAQTRRKVRIEQQRQVRRRQRAGQCEEAAAAVRDAAREHVAAGVAPERIAAGVGAVRQHGVATVLDPGLQRGRRLWREPDQPAGRGGNRRHERLYLEIAAAGRVDVPRRDCGAQVAQRGRRVRRMAHQQMDRLRCGGVRRGHAARHDAPVERMGQARPLAVEAGEFVRHDHDRPGIVRQRGVEFAQQARQRHVGIRRRAVERRETRGEPAPVRGDARRRGARGAAVDAGRDDDPRRHRRGRRDQYRLRQQQREQGEQGEAQQQQPRPFDTHASARPHAVGDPAQRGELGRGEFEAADQVQQDRQRERGQRGEAERGEQGDIHCPSPFGRRCPEGADEGSDELEMSSFCRTLTPTPLPTGEGLKSARSGASSGSSST